MIEAPTPPEASRPSLEESLANTQAQVMDLLAQSAEATVEVLRDQGVPSEGTSGSKIDSFQGALAETALGMENGYRICQRNPGLRARAEAVERNTASAEWMVFESVVRSSRALVTEPIHMARAMDEEAGFREIADMIAESASEHYKEHLKKLIENAQQKQLRSRLDIEQAIGSMEVARYLGQKQGWKMVVDQTENSFLGGWNLAFQAGSETK